MSLETVLLRIQELNTAFAPRPVPTTPPTSTSGGDASFANALQGAMAPGGAAPGAPIAAPMGGGVGARLVAIAQREMGVAESPPGSNNSARIAQYRTATRGAPGPGPWCAYFLSWVARQAGVPIGDNGSGYGAVEQVWSWAQRTGKALPASATPRPGDLIVWGGRHIGMVERVAQDGTIHTIEGNSSDKVSRRSYRPGSGMTGYVRLG
jgi:uncharacterized protein (TIGR02594 family)